MSLTDQMTRGAYGVQEQNSSTLEETYDRLDQLEQDGDFDLALNDRRLTRITRLRMISDPGFPFWDVSYCYGVMKDGRTCRVSLPEVQFPKRNLKGAIIAMCTRERVYAKGLGLLDSSNYSFLV
jgi:hypothetical protein